MLRNDSSDDYFVSIRPSLIQALIDLLKHFQWTKFAYIYQDMEGKLLVTLLSYFNFIIVNFQTCSVSTKPRVRVRVQGPEYEYEYEYKVSSTSTST